MIPILFPQAETSFLTNGIGRLTDCISCTVTEERNGIFECEFTYPVTGRHYDEIREGCIIFATHDDTRTPQPFDIYKRTAPIDGVVTFNAHHISYRLGTIVARPFTAGSCAEAIQGFKDYSINENPFVFWTSKVITGEYNLKTPANVREKLFGSEGSLLDVYGTGEYRFDKFRVELYVNRGEDTAVQIRYGKNITDLTDEIDYSGIFNAVVPFWKHPETDELVMLPEVMLVASGATYYLDNWTDEQHHIITDEDGTAIEFKYPLLQPTALDLSEAWGEAPTVEELRTRARNYLEDSNAWLPNHNITVDFVQLWATEEYADYAPLQQLRLCDTAEVIYSRLGVNVREKVVKTVYNVLLDRYDSMELGMVRQSYSDMLLKNTIGTVNKEYVKKTYMETAIEGATRLITGGLGGNVVINTNAAGRPNEILIMDTEDKETAVNVIRMNNAGIGFSTNGYNGPFLSAWTIDGAFVADFITAGTMSADRIRAGTIYSEDERTYWNLDTGEMVTRSEDDTAIELNDGHINIYEEDVVSGRIGAYRIAQSGSGNETIAMGIIGNNTFISNNENSMTLYINGDDSGDTAPYGYTERILLLNSTRFRGAARHEGSIQLRTSDNTEMLRLAMFSDSNNPYLLIGDTATYFDVRAYIGGTLTLIGRVHTDTSYNGLVMLNNGLALACPKNTSTYITFTTGTYTPTGGSKENVLSISSKRVLIGSVSAMDQYHFRIDGGGSFNGIVACTRVIETSDARLKDVQQWDEAYDDVLDALEPVLFKWKNGDDDKTHIGFIAQSVQEALTDNGITDSGIVGDKDETYLGLSYTELIPLLLKKIQKQGQEIKELKTKADNLENKLEALCRYMNFQP